MADQARDMNDRPRRLCATLRKGREPRKRMGDAGRDFNIIERILAAPKVSSAGSKAMLTNVSGWVQD